MLNYNKHTHWKETEKLTGYLRKQRDRNTGNWYLRDRYESDTPHCIYFLICSYFRNVNIN